MPRSAPAGWPGSKRCLLSALRQSLGPSSKAKSQFCQLTINLGPWQFGVSTLPEKGRRPAPGLTQNKHLRAESPWVEEVGQAHTQREALCKRATGLPEATPSVCFQPG